MNSDIISKSILNEMEDVVYISDPNTYELYYMNAILLQTLGNPTDAQWRRKKCYKILQGRDTPCPFCTNQMLKHEGFYNWEHFNTLLNQYYFVQDKLVTFEGIEARLEIAKNITGQKLLEQDLTRRLEEQRVLNSCIALLHTSDSPHQSIHKLLGLVANYHQAERGYIFLLSENGEKVSNAYEWCALGVIPQIDALQNIDASVVDHWFSKYRAVGEFYIDSISEDLDQASPEYEILAMQEIESLVTAPLYNTDGSFMGFIGVDNPQHNLNETSVIRAVSSFVSDFLDKNRHMEKLYRISYFDNLTGLRNRHSYSLKIAELEERVPDMLGVIYVDINGLKAVNDKHGHKKGDEYIGRMGSFLSEIYGDCVFRIGGDEFVVICAGRECAAFEQQLKQMMDCIEADEYPCAAVGYSWRKSNCNVIEQVEAADHHMYQNKRTQYIAYAGKNERFSYKYRWDKGQPSAASDER